MRGNDVYEQVKDILIWHGKYYNANIDVEFNKILVFGIYNTGGIWMWDITWMLCILRRVYLLKRHFWIYLGKKKHAYKVRKDIIIMVWSKLGPR